MKRTHTAVCRITDLLLPFLLGSGVGCVGVAPVPATGGPHVHMLGTHRRDWY